MCKYAAAGGRSPTLRASESKTMAEESEKKDIQVVRVLRVQRRI
jgi:hypothetical protein